MFDHMEGIIKALAKKQIQWKVDIRRAMRSARSKLSAYYAEVTPESGLLLILVQMLDPYRKTRMFQHWDKRAGVSPASPGSYTSQYTQAFLDYWEKNYVSKMIEKATIKLEPAGPSPAKANAGSLPKPSNFVYCVDSDSDDEIPASLLTATPRRTNHRAQLVGIARQYLENSRIDAASIGQINPANDDSLTDPDANPNDVTGSFWSPSVAAWWKQQVNTASEYAPMAEMARDIFSVIPHGVGVEASFSLGRDVIGWRQSKTSGSTLQQKVVVRQWARSNQGILADTFSDTLLDNDVEGKVDAEQSKLKKLATLTDFMHWSKRSSELRAAQKKLRAQNSNKCSHGFISDEEEFSASSWDAFDDNGEGAFDTFISNKKPTAVNLGKVNTRYALQEYVKRIPRVDRQAGTTDVDTDEDLEDSDEEALWADTDIDDGDDAEESEEEVLSAACAQSADTDDEMEPEDDIFAAPKIQNFIKPRRSGRLAATASKSILRVASPPRKEDGTKNAEPPRRKKNAKFVQG